MRRVSLLLATGLVAATWAGSALADKGHGGRFFERLDQDGNGLITREEMQASRERWFGRLDHDGDGFVTMADLDARQAEREARRQERRAHFFERLDGDQDGRISNAEFHASDPSWLAEADSNGDGALSREELENAVRKKHEKHKKDN